MEKKLPKQVLEELEANPNISPSALEIARKATIRDEGWDRIQGDDVVLPEEIDTGLKVGDLVGMQKSGDSFAPVVK